MKQLTTLTAVGTMTSSLLGGGSLSLPFALSHSGLVVGIMAILTIASITSISCNLLVKSARKINSTSLDSLSNEAYGKRGSIVSVTMIFLVCWLAAVAYIMMISEHLLEVLPFPKDEDNEVKKKAFKPMMKFIVGIITFPLTTMRNLHGLRYTSIVSITFMFLLLILIGIRSMEKGVVFKKHKEEDEGSIKWWPDDLDSVTYSVSFVMGAYLCQFQVIPIYAELANPASMSTVINTALAIVSCLYLYISILGYFYALDDTCDTILHTFSKNDPYAQTARTLLSVALFFSYPLNVLPARGCVIQILTHLDMIPANAILDETNINLHQVSDEASASAIENDNERGNVDPRGLLENQTSEERNASNANSDEAPVVQLIDKYHYMLTGIIGASIILMAVALPTIALVWGILGSTLSVAIAFFLPPLFFLKLYQDSLTPLQKYGSYGMISLGVLICISSLTSTMIHASDPSCPK